MKRKHLLIALATATLLGCGADNRSSIEITGRAAPSDAKTCKFAPGGETLMGPGLYDVSLGGQFDIVLYVQNNLTDPNTIAPGSLPQSKGWTVEAARIRVNPKEYTDRYKPSPGLAAISAESVIPVAASSTIEPAGGKATIATGLLSDGLSAALQSGAGAGGTVVLGITLQGRTNDGARLDSTEWPFPLDICAGCINAAPTCATGTTLVPTQCVGQTLVPSCQ